MIINIIRSIFTCARVVSVDENKSPSAEKESPHSKAERHAIYPIIDAVFGLSLGLGAFSLTELTITKPQDLIVGVGFFGFSYFIIFMSWMGIRVYFVDYIVYGSVNMILFFTGFFIAIMPIPLRIILMHFIEPASAEIFEVAFILYPICMSAITITMGLFSFAFSKQSGKTAPWEDLVHLLSDGVASFVMGVVFLISAFIPYEKSIQDVLGSGILSLLPFDVANYPFKVGFWFLGGIALVVPAIIITRLILWFRARES